MSRLVQQTPNQLCSYCSKTGPIAMDCSPGDITLPQDRPGKAHAAAAWGQGHLPGLVTLCSCFGLLSLLAFVLAPVQVEVIL